MPSTRRLSVGHARINRRQLLRGAGVALSLPLLESMAAPIARSDESEQVTPKRVLAICNNLGVLPDRFFPTEAGGQYKLTPYLQVLADFREHFTVFERRIASRRRRISLLGHIVLDRRTAPGERWLSKHGFARPIHRNVDRQPNTISVVDAWCECYARASQPLLD